ncbi:MAG: hypothetical protein NVS1B13_11650 [Flavisolibacter sp.]
MGLINIKVPIDSTAIGEGARIVRIEHCQHCHGEDFTGTAFHHYDYQAEGVASNITTILSAYCDSELERLIRHGVKKNATSVFYMPSAMYFSLKMEAVGKMIAYLRTIKPLPTIIGLPTHTSFLPYGRIELIRHHIKGVAEIIQGLGQHSARTLVNLGTGNHN